jgi:enoyl-CoA hydratase/carnithine racemase
MSIIYEKKGRIATITINRPEVRNAIDLETGQELIEAWTDFRDDPDVWAAILTGAGDKAFSSGADLSSVGEYYRSLTPFERRHLSETTPGLGGITRHIRIMKPIIAAINGYCFAGGLEMALACDFRLASDNAVFGLLEVTRGIIPGAGGTQRLPRIIPLTKALEMILLGRKIDAQEAFRIGLVNEVIPLSDLMPAAYRMAEEVCRNGPLAVQAAKEAVYRGLELPLEEGLRLEQFLAEPVRNSDDAKEGVQAFLKKRDPRFKGR